jgi:hypothetical protein
MCLFTSFLQYHKSDHNYPIGSPETEPMVQYSTSLGGLMPGTLVFIHGTSVRDQSFQEYTRLIEAKLKGNTLGLPTKLLAPAWFTEFGIDAYDVLDALPIEYRSQSLPEEPGPVERAEIAWRVLLDDPTHELRLIAARRASDSPTPSRGSKAARKQLASLIEVLGDPSTASRQLGNVQVIRVGVGGIDAQDLIPVLQWLTGNKAFLKATGTLKDHREPEFVLAFARAVAAAVIAARLDNPSKATPLAATSKKYRDDLIEAVRAAWDSGSLSVSATALDFIIGLANPIARERRASLHGATARFFGDILWYLRRGKPVLDYLALQLQEIPESDGPVIVLAQSLGGIMMVDLLSRPVKDRPHVDLLVTFGSQSPVLYGFDALEYLRPKKQHSMDSTEIPTGIPFTPWLNIYDRKDLLSFCAEGMFPGVKGIRDVSIDSGLRFPESHGGYFTNDRMYMAIAERAKDLGILK